MLQVRMQAHGGRDQATMRDGPGTTTRRHILKATAAAASLGGLAALSWPTPAQASEAELDVGLAGDLPPLPQIATSGSRELQAAGWRGRLARSGGVRPGLGGAGTPRRGFAGSGALRGDHAGGGRPRPEYAQSGRWHAGIDPGAPGRRSVRLFNVHTQERLSVEFFADGEYRPEALAGLNHFLRDWRYDAVVPIDPGVIEILALIQRAAPTDTPIYILSAYRTPQTNAMLARTNSLVARNSLHMQGKAIDLVLPGYRLAGVRDFAIALQAGGVGYYPGHNFIHVDTGRVRTWVA
jgi:uncharacterized protein YcbK (DUF882 family)